MRTHFVFTAVTGVALAACSSSSVVRDFDASVLNDAGHLADASVAPDSGDLADSGTPFDGSWVDAGQSDSGSDAAFTTDGGALDAGTFDGGPPLCPTPPALAATINAAAQGDTLSLAGVDPEACLPISMAPTWSGGALLFSDSPESPTTTGILYDDATLGPTPSGTTNRLYLYHVDGSLQAMRFGVVLTNLGSAAGTLNLGPSGTAGPTTSYGYAGKAAFQRWLQSSSGTGTSVPAGSTVEIDSTFDSILATNGQLMHGIWDYSFTQPHRVTFCALGSAANFAIDCLAAAPLPRDSHDRGTFPNSVKTYDSAPGVVIDAAFGMQWFAVASGTGTDLFEVGVDATSGNVANLGGNYGVLYRIHLATRAPVGANLAFLLDPRGGAWGGAVNAEPGRLPGGVFLVPSGSSMLGDPSMAVVEGDYAPGSAFTVWLQFMPAGGSSFPVDLVAVPH